MEIVSSFESENCNLISILTYECTRNIPKDKVFWALNIHSKYLSNKLRTYS